MTNDAHSPTDGSGQPGGSSPGSGGGSASRLVLHNTREDVERAGKAVIGEVESRGYDTASCFAIRLALEEALTNAFRHGNRNDPAKTVTVEFQVRDDAVEIAVEDQGHGFDPSAVPDPTADENLEIPSGRGIVLMKSFMAHVEFIHPGNRVSMRYKRPEDS